MKPNTNRKSPFDVDLPHRLFLRRQRAALPPTGQPGREELIERLRKFGMFADLPKDILHKLAASAHVGTFRAGEYLWRQGEANSRVLFINQGLAKTTRQVRGGASRTYGLYGPGDSMGIYAMWAGMTYPTDAVAMTDGMTAIVLSSAALLKCAHRQPRLAAPMMTEIGRFTESFMRKIEIVSAGSVPQRLAVLMDMLVERYGNTSEAHAAHLPIHLTLEQIGEIVDARLETVARVLSRWKRQDWLRVNKDGFHFTRMDKVRSLLPGPDSE
ncbi:MAG: Crp/Fnr family transcriptional regulator [Thiobacillus sp.]|nr:Crp/Fnr family transcriptional regulator [Thiobacillus sp.]